jgi:hypothetical protein
MSNRQNEFHDGAILVGFMWIAGGRRATDAQLAHLMVM